MKYGILIGRFQPFHKGHQSIIEQIIDDKLTPLIFIDSSNKNDEKNPFSYAERAAMVNAVFRNIHVNYGCGDIITLPLPDVESDEAWANKIRKYLEYVNINKNDCSIYYHRKEGDPDISEHLKDFKFIKLYASGEFKNINATAIRANPLNHRKDIPSEIQIYVLNKLLKIKG